MRKHFKWFPEIIPKKKQSKEKLIASNAGIFGGLNYSFFKELRSEAFLLLDKNRVHFEKVPVGYMNIMAEQYLFNLLAEKNQVPITYLIKQPVTHPEYINLQKFSDLPLNCDYIHIMGAKSSPYVCEQMANRLYLEDTERYYKCKEITKSLSNLNFYMNFDSTKISKNERNDYNIENQSHVLQMNDFFYRTNLALEYLKIRNTATDLEELISIIDNARHNNLSTEPLKDVFKFELLKFELTNNLINSTLVELLKNEIINANNLCKLLAEEFDKIILKIKNNNQIIRSKWCWTEINEFYNPHGKDARIETIIKNNFRYTSENYYTFVYNFFHQGILVEHTLDGLNKFIIELLWDSPLSFDELYCLLIEKISNVTINHNLDKIVVRSRIQHLLYEGILANKI
jgi:hypothetical protein